jgi:hypothetical protein
LEKSKLIREREEEKNAINTGHYILPETPKATYAHMLEPISAHANGVTLPFFIHSKSLHHGEQKLLAHVSAMPDVSPFPKPQIIRNGILYTTSASQNRHFTGFCKISAISLPV